MVQLTTSDMQELYATTLRATSCAAPPPSKGYFQQSWPRQLKRHAPRAQYADLKEKPKDAMLTSEILQLAECERNAS